MDEMTKLSTGIPLLHSLVLNTIELLENILLHLDMRSLLISALRVCRRWRDLIRFSVPLRIVLFIEGDKSPAKGHEVVYNPLLANVFPPFFDLAHARHSRAESLDDQDIEALPIGRRTRAFYRRNASWRRMHVRQPPVENVGLWTFAAGMIGSETMVMTRYPAGLRMESLYTLVLKHSYWFRCFVSWGEEKRGDICQFFKFFGVKKPWSNAEDKMLSTADVIVAAKVAFTCTDEDDDRKSRDGNGLVPIGNRRFKIKEGNDGDCVWEENKAHFWD